MLKTSVEECGRIPEKPVSRIAPTPSGFLHLGNAVNFLVTWALVRRSGGVLHLRIDDMDGIRFRPDVLSDIFFSLQWLGIDWDSGPEGPDSFHRDFSLQAKRDYYRSELVRLRDETGALYACGCSRSVIKKLSNTGIYPGACRPKAGVLIPDETAMRVVVQEDAWVDVAPHRINVADVLGDFVVWRKDDQPAYQFASLLEDEAMGMTCIVRGDDLLHSTAAQLYLAQQFSMERFQRCAFVHHDLVLGESGEKLSKSRGAYALKDVRDAGGSPVKAVQLAARVLGLCPEEVHTTQDLCGR